jgi:hypothetical protein
MLSQEVLIYSFFVTRVDRGIGKERVATAIRANRMSVCEIWIEREGETAQVPIYESKKLKL